MYYNLMESAFNDIGFELSNDIYDKFILYMNLLKEWNQKINLTTIIEDEDIIKKHFIDSIKIYNVNEFRNLNKIIDIGTGAGFPGIPISIIDNSKEVLLLDTLKKRVNFLNEVISKLNLKNVTAIHSRAEDLAHNNDFREKFDASVSRAVANLSVLSEYSLPFVKQHGLFIAMKGPSITEEMEISLKAIKILGGKLNRIIEVNIENTDLRHNLVVIDKINSCSKIYPRKPSIISKKPLI